MSNEPIVKRYGVDFESKGGALTLGACEVCDFYAEGGFHTRTHNDGWRITGCIKEDYYTWVNDFHAHHPEYGCVWGNFEYVVLADSEEGFQHFYEHHAPHDWDYGDI